MAGQNKEDIIGRIREIRRKEVRFFSNEGKTEREIWVVKEFLSALAVPFSDEELVSPEQADNVDVRFRDANFQIKEILDPSDRRHARVHRELRLAEEANSLAECFEVSGVQDIVPADGYDEILKRASASRYPPKARKELDLLFYVTRPHLGLDPAKQPEELSELGWRSIACLFGAEPRLLVINESSPSFLRSRFGG